MSFDENENVTPKKRYPRWDASGPFIAWEDHGEGWSPKSYDTVADMVRDGGWGETRVLTQRAKIEIKETQKPAGAGSDGVT